MPAGVTVVVLSYNRPELLEKALQSITAQSCQDVEILVVDNRSPQSARVAELVRGFHGVRLAANATNVGFTGGMNQGLALARGKYVYLTEDDLELAPDCLARLVEYLEDHPETALAGPVMWNVRTPSIRCAGGDFELRSTYRMRVAGVGQNDLPAAAPYRTHFLAGAMIAGRVSELRRLGGFHPDFFMYGEDVELCARVREQGLAMAVVPAARVYHHDPPEQPESALVSFHTQKNLVALYLLHAPLTVLPLFFLRYGVIDGVRRLMRSGPSLAPWVRAWAWAARNTPKLLSERWKRAG
jgi:GT2 family glycosyltransferase